MKILTLDLSKRSTGWAFWGRDDDKPIFGLWVLGSEYTRDGQVCSKLQSNLVDLHRLTKFDKVFFEKPLTEQQRGGQSNPANDIQIKLVGHAESFCHAYGLAIQGIEINSWRKSFIGSQKRGTKSPTLKALTMERCRQFGWNVRKDDEADALGLLDYSATLSGLTPPWRIENALLPALGARA